MVHQQVQLKGYDQGIADNLCYQVLIRMNGGPRQVLYARKKASVNKKLSKNQKKQRRLEEIKVNASKLLRTEDYGYLEADGIEKTYKLSQDDLESIIPSQAVTKRFELALPSQGSYRCDLTQSGKGLLIGGRRGHVAAFERETGRLICELNLDETVRDVKWLQNENSFAVAQRRYVYLYDRFGSEIHRLEKHQEVDSMEYLPYHYLLSTIGSEGVLRYQDVSTGQIMAEWTTNCGRAHSMTQNPSNAVISLGHSSGSATFWSPAVNGPLVTMQCHKSPIKSMAIDYQGRYLATSGLDGVIKVWDLRTFRPLHQYHPVRYASSLAISQRGLLAATYGSHITIWKDGLTSKTKEPYMQHLMNGYISSSLKFCPFDDVLTVGHSGGVSSLVVPGAGEPNFDGLEANPFSSKRHQKEAEVKRVLEKLPAETINISHGDIGSIATNIQERRAISDLAQNLKGNSIEKGKRGLNGRSLKRLKQRENIIAESSITHSRHSISSPANLQDALKRFRSLS